MSKEDEIKDIPPNLSDETMITDSKHSILGQKRVRPKIEEENIKNEISNSSKFENVLAVNTITQVQVETEKISSLNNQVNANIDQKNNQNINLVESSSENIRDFRVEKTFIENNKKTAFCNLCEKEKNNLYLLNEISSSKLIKEFLNAKLNITDDIKNIISIGIDKIFFNQKKLQNKSNIFVCENCIWKEFINGGIEKLIVLFNNEIFKTNNKNNILDLKEILLMNTKILEKISLINKNCKTATFDSDAEIKNLQSNLDECLNDLNINNLLLNKFIENYEIIKISNFFTSNVGSDNKNDYIGTGKNISANERQILILEKNKNDFEINKSYDNKENNKILDGNFPTLRKPEIISSSNDDKTLFMERNGNINILANKNQVGNRKILYTIFTKNAIHEVNNDKFPKNCQAKIFQTDIVSDAKKETINKYSINTQKIGDNFNIIRNTSNVNNENFIQNNIFPKNEYKEINNINLLKDAKIINDVNNANNSNVNNIITFNEHREKIVNNPKNQEKIYDQYNEQIKNMENFYNLNPNKNNNNLSNINRSNMNNNIIGRDINNLSNKNNNDCHNNTQGNQFKDILMNYLISSFQLNQKLLNQITDSYKVNNNNKNTNNTNYIQKNDLIAANKNILQAINSINTTNINTSFAKNLSQRNTNINIPSNNQNIQDQNNQFFIGSYLPMKNIPNINNNNSITENNNQSNNNMTKFYDDLTKRNIYNNNKTSINDNFTNNNFNKIKEPIYINENINDSHFGYSYINTMKKNTNNCYNNNNINGMMNINNNIHLMNQITNNLRNNENMISSPFNNIFNQNVYPSSIQLQKLDPINNFNSNFNLNINTQKSNIAVNNNTNNNFNMNNSNKNTNVCNMNIKNDSLEKNKFHVKIDLDDLNTK